MTALSPPIPTPAKDGALVLVSGGQDSAVCLAWALERYEHVETVGFDYGQRHAVELEARRRVMQGLRDHSAAWNARLGDDHLLDLRAFGDIGQTALTTDRAIEAAEGGLPSTFVPGRNLVFLLYAGALADRRRLKALVGGMCETDFSGYPDCRRDTLDAFQKAMNLGMAQAFRIETPLMWLTKAQTWGLAQTLGGAALVELILEDSHTCYRGERGPRRAWGYGCGQCPACELRAQGWEQWVATGRPPMAAP